MKIDVSDLLKSFGVELKIDRSETLSFPPVGGADKEESLNLTSPVQVKLKLMNTGDTVLVSGTLKTRVKLCCCRCLKEFDYPLNIEIEEEYGRKKSALPGSKDEEIELKEKDFVFEIGEDNIIDLDEAIRQNIIVSLPIKPLCSKACKVAAPASENKKSIDPRLAKLKSFKILGGN